jgi:hypothetical protein
LHLCHPYDIIDAIRAVRNIAIITLHVPSNQTTKRAQNEEEGQKKRRVAPIQSGIENLPLQLAGFVPQIVPGRQGDGNVVKRSRGLIS